MDPSEFGPIKKFLDGLKGFGISHILCTHKHGDHVGGAKDLIKYCKKVYGKTPAVIAGEKENLSFVTQAITKNTSIKVGNIDITITLSPCHTKGHVLYYM